MRGWRICALMISLCLLSACGSGDGGSRADELALEIRGEYLSMTGCTADLELTADYGQRVYTYGMTLSYQQGGDTTVTVTAPEEVAGVTARISGENTYLEYDGVSLETGPLDETGLSPVGAVPLMLRCVREGFIAESGMEELDDVEYLRVVCRAPEEAAGSGTEVTLWFEPMQHTLVRGEVSVDGVRVIGCAFTNFLVQ